MSETEIQEQPVGIDEALNQMKEDGHPPTGFHMMFFSEDFTLKDDCPTNQLLQMVGSQYGFADTIKRQVYNMPNLQKPVANTILMVEDGMLSSYPKARVSFLTTNGGEEE